MPKPHALHRFFNAEFTLARILLAKGKYDQLGTVLRSLAETTGQTNHRRFKIDVLGLQALMEEAQGNEEQAIALLQQAVLLAQSGGLVRPLADLGPGLVKLLNRLDLDQEGLQFVGSILAALQESGTAYVIQPDQQGLIEPLSDRELDVLKLFAENLSNREVGETLFISPGTVKRHAHNIYGKLAVHSRKDAVSKAIGLGLLKPG
jgi:LuxR family maltose regulon positive regulatory protein